MSHSRLPARREPAPCGAHRALEAHALAIGYDLIAWISHALERTRAKLAEIEPGLVEGGAGLTYAQVRRTAVALTRAAAATADDDLRVPDETGTALGHLLALYMITNEAITT
jgi:hypothetical protein